MTEIITLKQIDAVQGEPRILDTDLANALGLKLAYNIRPMIAANRGELETHGPVVTREVKTTTAGGRPGRAYLLNEGQALVICSLSRTKAAARVRKALIDAFLEYKRRDLEKTVHVREHNRRPPTRRSAEDMHAHFVSFFRAFRDQPEALADWACAHLGASLQSLQDFSGIR